ncbi:CapA family protein [Desulfolucanica intricata]|uniref:CapA family protein n=1 Tax=Desulfolucanica intricata TaxID=1285191 RepID=UPI000B09F220|nr:CapA family protein [Desulfolucanica intricata]
MNKKFIKDLFIFILLFLLSVSFYTNSIISYKINQAIEEETKQPSTTTIIKLTAIGDFLMHIPIINSAYDTTTQSYDFKPIFEPVAEYLNSADLTIGNLETRLAGKERGYSGYPCFNCPAALADDLKVLGVDILATANNHSMDMGYNGLITTLNNLEQAGLEYIGNARSPEERKRLLIKEVKGIKLGFLNYTETTNGIPLPPGKEYAVNMVDLDIIKQDIENLKKKHVDLVIVYLHFGTEYMRQPTAAQKKLARDILNSGADIILGDHVHVLQPMEKIHEKFIIYSLGNFISNQRWQYSDSGVILNLEIEKNQQTGKTSLKKAAYIPVWVDTYNSGGKLRYRVLPVEKAIYDYQKGQDSLLTAEDYSRLQQVWEETTALLSVPEQEIMPVMLIEKTRT